MNSNLIDTLINLYQKHISSDAISYELSQISQIPSLLYQQFLPQEAISSTFFTNNTNIESILHFLTNLSTSIDLNLQTPDLLVFQVDLLTLLLRRSLNNASEDQSQAIYICNNYSLQFNSDSPHIQQLFTFLTNNAALLSSIQHINHQIDINSSNFYLSLDLLLSPYKLRMLVSILFIFKILKTTRRSQH